MRINNRVIHPNEKDYKPSDERYTPKWIFEALEVVFDLDVCAPKEGSNANAKFWFHKEIDGLAQRWHGNVWMNPPFSGVTPWVDKFIDHRQGIALLPMGKSKWLTNIWNQADGVVMLPSNLKFILGDKQEGISTQTALFAFGENNVKALHKIGKVR